MEKITVVIPVYNVEKVLDKLLKSLESQTVLERLEIIFVNDGSTDNTLRKIEEFVRETKIKDVKIIDKKNGGVSSARNEGIRHASTKYIAFLDSDDYIDKDYFESYLNYIDKDYDLIVSGYIAEYNDTTKFKNNYSFEEIYDVQKVLKKYFMGTIDPNCWNKIYKTSIIKKVMFDETMHLGEDREMLFNYILKIHSVCFTSFAKYHYKILNNSASRRKFNDNSIKMLEMSNKRVNIISNLYDNLVPYAISSDIDVKCRVLCKMIEDKMQSNYKEIYIKLHNDIKKYKISDKKKFSTKKHFLSFLLVKINPRLYNFIKNNLKYQYKSNRKDNTMKKIKVAYSNLYNAGDLMNKDIIEKIGNYHIVRSKTFCADMIAIGGALVGLQYDKKKLKKICQMFLRLIYAHKPIYVWGSGFFNDDNNNKLYRNNLKVCALRGEKTKLFLEKLTGKNYDVLLADAGLLVDTLIEKSFKKKYKIGIIPHMWHKEEKSFVDFGKLPGVHFIDIMQTPQQVAFEISECETIVSSSLHGLIFADSLHIPNMHVLGDKELKGGNFKFDDYYSSYGLKDKARKLSEYVPTYEEIIKNYKINSNLVEKKKKGLLEVFPNFE